MAFRIYFSLYIFTLSECLVCFNSWTWLYSSIKLYYKNPVEYVTEISGEDMLNISQTNTLSISLFLCAEANFTENADLNLYLKLLFLKGSGSLLTL